MIYFAVEGWETQTPRVKRVEMICETTYYEARASRWLPPVVDGNSQEDLSLFFFSLLWCLYLSVSFQSSLARAAGMACKKLSSMIQLYLDVV